MNYNMTIKISIDELEEMNDYIENGGLDVEDTAFYTANFPNGYLMDVKVCGADEDPAWAEAVLFNPQGNEVSCSQSDDCSVDGTWKLEDKNGNTYSVEVTS